MQLTVFALIALPTLATAFHFYEDTLPEIVKDIPTCALACYAQKAAAQGCQTSDFGCVCDRSISIAADMSLCVPDRCSAFDASAAFGELCVRWALDPPATEVAAATSTLALLAASASASVLSTTGAPTPTNTAGRNRVGVGCLGAAALAGMLMV